MSLYVRDENLYRKGCDTIVAGVIRRSFDQSRLFVIAAEIDGQDAVDLAGHLVAWAQTGSLVIKAPGRSDLERRLAQACEARSAINKLIESLESDIVAEQADDEYDPREDETE